MRLTSLTAAAIMGAALLVPMGAATAAGETCQGQPATIVGTPGGTITGTEGADVIVTNGAAQVDALGGDDRVCATGVRTTAVLGAGADTFVAEVDAYHVVVAGAADYTDTETDVIRSTSGYVVVRSGMTGQPNADTVETAAATVYWQGIQTAPSSVSVTGGALDVTTTADAAIDAQGGTMTAEGTSLTYAGHFSDYSLRTAAESGLFTFRGTHATERLEVDAPTTYDRDVTLGGGDDTYRTNGLGGKASIVTGNTGEDRLLVDLPTRRLKSDLGRRITDNQNGSKTLIRGFEDYVIVAKTAKVRGTNRGETMDLVTCKAWVNAGPGKDAITHSVEFEDGDELGTPRCGKYRAVVNGGRGRDTINGGPGDDRLLGNRGRDTINGGPGRDACEGERRVRCERRLRSDV